MGDVILMRDFETAEERKIKADRLHDAIMAEVFGLETPDEFPICFQAPPDDCA